MVAAYVAKYRPEWLERDLRKKNKPGAAAVAPEPQAPVPDGPIEGE